MTLAYVLAAHFGADDASDDAPNSASSAAHRRAEPTTAADALDDAVLFERVRAGNAEAFETLFFRYRASLCAFAARYTGSAAIAEELVHDVFLWIWRTGAGVRAQRSVRGYLFGAVRHRALDAAERGAVATRARMIDPELLGASIPAPPDAAVEATELRTVVRAAIATLSERRRAVITLRWAHQLTFAEIAHALGVSVRTAETTHLRAMEDLRRRLAGIHDRG